MERNAQNLPIPLGGMAPVHRHFSHWRTLWLRQRSRLLLAGAGALAAAALAVALSGPPLQAYRDGGTVRIENVELQLDVGASHGDVAVFRGPIAYALRTDGSGMRAAASGLISGKAFVGVCELTPAPGMAVEHCNFQISGRHLSSRDDADASGRWHRHFSDGVQATVDAPSLPQIVPLAVPIGH